MFSVYSGESAQLPDRYVSTAVYRGSRVAVRRVQLTHCNITRQLLVELKHIKATENLLTSCRKKIDQDIGYCLVQALQHDNLARFHGACLEPAYPVLVTEYCPRGSLQDILEDDEMKLDWNFKQSLITDIVKGLAYLHASPMLCHGNLKAGYGCHTRFLHGLGWVYPEVWSWSDNIVTASPAQSSNCVVDSRFLLKLTDFGLHSLRRFHLHSSKLHFCPV